MIGPSYLGLVQWALAPDAGDDLAALAIQVSASQFHGQAYAGGSLSLESAASWLVLVAAQERRLAPLAMVRALRRLPTLFAQLPIDRSRRARHRRRGRVVPRGARQPGPRGRYWVARDFAAGVGGVAAPVQLIGGWYDIFLPWMLEDFAALQAAGRAPQLIIGPWTHTAPGLLAAGIREGLGWLRAHLLDDRPAPAAVRPVRAFITGERAGGGWRELGSWPPPGTGERRLWLAAAAGRATQLGQRTDIAEPAPVASAGRDAGSLPLRPGRPHAVTRRTGAARARAGARQPPARGAAPTCSPTRTAPLPRRCGGDRPGACRAVGADQLAALRPVRARLRRRCRRRIVERLRRTDPRRRPSASTPTADDTVRVAFDLWPIGHRFAAGHRIRLQVSSGAHPRYARNPGTGEDLATATTLRPVDIEVLHDIRHPSLLVLPAAQAVAQQ